MNQIQRGGLDSFVHYGDILEALLQQDFLHFYLRIVYLSNAVTKYCTIFKYYFLLYLSFSSWIKLMIFYFNQIFVLNLDDWFVVLCHTSLVLCYSILFIYDINILSVIYCIFHSSIHLSVDICIYFPLSSNFSVILNLFRLLVILSVAFCFNPPIASEFFLMQLYVNFLIF